MSKYINYSNLSKGLKKFNSKKPFPFAIVDNFFKKSIANKLEREFPDYNHKKLHEYKNYCEVKKSSNSWNSFPSTTYKVFTMLNSESTLKFFSKKLNKAKLFSDNGLNGGGWHMMNNKGRLNPHLDYSIHPKMFLQRKYNLIVFLTKNWKKNWGGETCFYSKNDYDKKKPGKISKLIYPKFNRAIFFDTSKDSWHAVNTIKTKKIRKSIAVYYLVNPKKSGVAKRQKALYAPTVNQIYNKKVMKFIKLRSNSKLFSKMYKFK